MGDVLVLAEGDRVVSMAVIRHFEATPEERAAFLAEYKTAAGSARDMLNAAPPIIPPGARVTPGR